MTGSGQNRSCGHVGLMSGIAESGHRLLDQSGLMLAARITYFKKTVGRFVEIAPCEQSYTDAGA
jgi:hypothetical protein